MTIKVSFDFDSCLTATEVQEYASELISRGVQVYCVTTRWHAIDNPSKAYKNEDLFETCEKVGIELHNIRFTNGLQKFKFFKESSLDILFHLDDCWQEVSEISRNTKVQAVTNFGNKNWKAQCEKILKLALHKNKLK